MAPRTAGTATNQSTGCVTSVAAEPAATARPAAAHPGRSAADHDATTVEPADPTSGSSTAHTGASTASVNRSAAAYDTSASAGVVGFGLAAVVALVLAATVPLDVVVLGILVVGAVHVALEVRYVYGRHPTILSGPLLVAANGVLVAIVAVRLVSGTTPATARLEVLLLAGLVVAAALLSHRGSRPDRRTTLVVAAVVAGGALALALPGSWFVVQAHLHNLIPLAFLWLWAGGIADDRRRRRFRSVCVGWALVIPALVLAGALDPVLGSGGSATAAGLAEGASVTKGIAPATLGSTWAPRLLAAFAFAQVLHYVTWCWFFPHHAPDATATFEAGRVGRHLRGLRLPILAAAATAAVLVLALSEYRAGRTTYLSFASYHAYLEYPVLVAVAAGALATGASPGKEPTP